MYEARKAQVLEKINQLIARANQLYNITLPPIATRFDLRGRSAGQASYYRGQYAMRFNTDMMTNDGWDHLFNNTVPHELAHIVCFYKPQLGRNHDNGWRRVCVALGGNGERCHKEEVTYAKGNTYNYRTTSGHVIAVSQVIHQRIQQGRTYRLRQNKGALNRQCEYKLQSSEVWTKPAQAAPAAVPAFVPPVQVVAPRMPEVLHLGPTFVDITAPRRPTQSKAELLRSYLRENKQHGKDSAILWAVQQFGWPRAQARSSVEFNWNRA